MKSVADDLESKLAAVARLLEIDEETASRRPAPGKWCHKETIGHLIDSAANNHQRFIRMQMQEHLELKGYDGDEWVRIQQYQNRPWREIVMLWESYNRQLAHVIRLADPKSLKHTWVAPEGETVDLEFVIRDYVVNMQHHLDQVL